MQTPEAGLPSGVLSGASVATGLMAPVALGVAAAAAGPAGVAGSAVGIAVVVLFFSASLVVLSRVGGSGLLPAALGLYVLKIVALGVALRLLGGLAALNHTALGWSAFAALVVWLGAEVTLLARARVPYVQPVPERSYIKPSAT